MFDYGKHIRIVGSGDHPDSKADSCSVGCASPSPRSTAQCYGIGCGSSILVDVSSWSQLIVGCLWCREDVSGSGIVIGSGRFLQRFGGMMCILTTILLS
jgi:hypothetical protein